MEKSPAFTTISSLVGPGELRAYYQPKHDATTGRLKAAEALVRWLRQDGTAVLPGRFLPELEKTEAILAVDWSMLEEVCGFLEGLQQSGVRPVPMSVNFSRWHLFEGDVQEHMVRILDGHGLDHSLIVVEITESAMIYEPELMQHMIGRLHQIGVQISIDDFGSGLSSFSMVANTPADEIKIDRSLLAGNCEDERTRIILESIFQFAHRLNLRTVAEGVETKEQLGFLRTCNCQLVQGFYFDKPLPANEFRQRLIDCDKTTYDEDILEIQSMAAAQQLLLDAVFMRYPLVIFINLSKNSYYMMTYENFTSRGCPPTGNFDELIGHGAMSMHPDDRETWGKTFSVANQLRLYDEGCREIHLTTRQIGDDGIYRKVTTNNYFVKNPASRDVLVISLCNNVEE